MSDRPSAPQHAPTAADQRKRVPVDLRIDEIAVAFEKAWQSAPQAPSIDDFLTAPGVDRAKLLAELVQVDLEQRLTRGEAARVEEYVGRYPELAGMSAHVVALAAFEYRLRVGRGEPVLAKEFVARFPDHVVALRREFEQPPVPPPGRAVRLNCPHCHHPIELVAAHEDEVVCSSCGSSFLLDAERTRTWSQEKLPKLGRFELLSRIGIGGFGTVYKAFDSDLKRTVALKLPRSGTLADQEDEDRFLREARNAAQLRHSGIVPVFEVGRSEQFPYIVSELVDGITLADTLTGRRFSFREAARLVRQLAEALDYSHRQGVVHRDLKPSNIMLSVDDTPRIMDFGLAKRDAGEITMTIDGQVLGTPAYMSPEQASGQGHHVDGRSDVYSLGVILYEILTGELPFRGNQRMLLHQVLHDEPRAPRSLNDRIPRDLETITLKCLEKDRERRYQSAQALADELQRILRHEPILARPIGGAERTWRWCKRNPTVSFLAATVLFTLLGGAVVSGYFAWNESVQHQQAEELAGLKGLLATQLKTALDEQEQATRRAEFDAARLRFEQGWSAQLTGDTLRALHFMAHSLAEMERLDFGGQPVFPRAWDVPSFKSSVRSHLLQIALGPMCPRNRLAHHDAVDAVAFSPDGTKLITQFYDTQIPGRPIHCAWLWDIATGHWLGEPEWRAGPVNHLAFSPNGKLLAMASKDVTIWDIAARTALGEPCRHDGRVVDVVFSGDGTKLATASRDHMARVWDAVTGQPLGAPCKHGGAVLRVGFSPDDTKLATVSDDGTAQLWDITTDQPLGAPCKYDGGVLALTFSPDGPKLATVLENDTARIWDIEAGTPLGSPCQHEGSISDAAFSPDGRTLATAGWDRTARLWDAATGQPLARPCRHLDMVNAVAFSPDGGRIATASNDKTARMWDAATGAPLGEPCRHENGVGDVAFSPDGLQLATASSDGNARLWDVAGSPLSAQAWRHEGPVNHLAFSPNGRQLATASDDMTARIWDVARGTSLVEPCRHDGPVVHLVFSRDGTKLASASQDHTVRVWDAATGKPLGEPCRHEGAVFRVTFSADGALLATLTGDGAVQMWDAATCKPASNPRRHAIRRTASFRFVGNQLATYNGIDVQPWDIVTGTPMTLWPCDGARAIAINPSGTKFARALHDWTARLFDASTGKTFGDSLEHEGRVIDIAFSADGLKLATASSDMTARVWDASMGKPLGAPFWHRSAVTCVAFSPDGTKLATATKAGVARLWDIPNSYDMPAAQLLLWVELQTGLEMNENGELSGIAREDRKRDELPRLGGPPREWTRMIECRRLAVERQRLDIASAFLASNQHVAALWHVDRWLETQSRVSPSARLAEAQWLRARCLLGLGREQEAAVALNAAWLALKPAANQEGAEAPALDADRFALCRDVGLSLSGSGQDEQAIACLEMLRREAESLAARTNSAVHVYNQACACSILAGVVAGSPNGVDRAATLRDQAIALLRNAMKRGGEDLDYMENDRDLDAVRDHPDYAEMMKELDAASATN